MAVNGNNILEVAKISEVLIQEAREKSQPSLLVLDTYRQREHCGVNFDDNLNYRNEKEVQKWLSKDPIEIAIKTFIEKNIITEIKINEIKNKIKNEVEVSFKHALDAPFPKPSMAKNFIFSD